MPTQESKTTKPLQNNVQEPTQVSNDFQNNVYSIFDTCEEYVKQYRQLVENLQLEPIHSFKGFYDSVVQIEQEFAKNYGVKYPILEIQQKIIENSINATVNMIQTQSKILGTTLNTTQNNIKKFNESLKLPKSD